MKSTVATIFLTSLLLITFSSAVLAGAYSPWGISVQLPNNLAKGSLEAASYQETRGGYIGCQYYAATDKTTKRHKTPKPAIYMGSCMATSGTVQAGCVTDQPEYLAVIASLDNSSYLHFEWDDNGNCTKIINVHRSDFVAGHPEDE